MLTANLDGNRVHAKEMEDHRLDYLCPLCNSKMSLVKPKKCIIDHFRHYAITSCLSEPETMEHLKGKQYIYELFKNYGYNAFLEQKISVIWEGRQIELYPDILLKSINKVAIEFQCSPITMDEFLRKTKIYTENNIYCLWIFGIKKFRKVINEDDDIVQIRNIEKKAHELYFGNVYYFDRNVFLNKYEVYTEDRVSDWTGNEWTKFYKKIRVIKNSDVIVFPVVELRRNTWKGNNYLVALVRRGNL